MGQSQTNPVARSDGVLKVERKGMHRRGRCASLLTMFRHGFVKIRAGRAVWTAIGDPSSTAMRGPDDAPGADTDQGNASRPTGIRPARRIVKQWLP